MKKHLFIKKLLVLLVVLITCIPQMWANWQVTVYFSPKAEWISAGYNYKINTRYDHTQGYWNRIDAVSTGKTQNGKPVYSCQVDLWDNWDHVSTMQIQAFDGNGTQQDQRELFKDTYDVKTATYSGKWHDCDYDNNVWYTLSYDNIVSGGKIYFNNTNTSWGNNYIQFAVGHSSLYRTHTMTALSGTKLFYLDYDSETYHTWNDATYSGIFYATSEWPDGDAKNYSDIQSYAPKKSTTLTVNYSNQIASGTSYLYSAASGSDNNTLSRNVLSGYSDLNKNQTVHIMLSDDNGSSYTEITSRATWPGTVKATRTYLTGNGTVTTKSGDDAETLSKDAYIKTAALTSTFTVTESSTATGYTFEGYGSSSSATPDGQTSYTLNNISGTNDIYVFFKSVQSTLTFDMEGGLGGPSNRTVYYGTTLAGITGSSFPTKASNGFDGFWTEDNGNGIQVIKEDGTVKSGVEYYTDASGNWIRTSNTTLYARWMPVGYYVAGKFNNWVADPAYHKFNPSTLKASFGLLKKTFEDEGYKTQIKIRKVNAGSSSGPSNTWYGKGASDGAITMGKDNPKETGLSTSGKNIALEVNYDGTYEFTITEGDGTIDLEVAVPVVNRLEIYNINGTTSGTVDGHTLPWLTDDWEDAGVANTVTKTIQLERGKYYDFKPVYDSYYYGKTPTANITYNATPPSVSSLVDKQNNLHITADLKGNYKFDFNYSTKTITVTYPTRRSVTYTVSTLRSGNGTESGADGTLSATNDDDSDYSISSGGYVADGNTVTFTAPSAKAGYTWRGWYSVADPSADYSKNKLSDGTATSFSTAVSGGNKTVYAVYSEDMYSISVDSTSNYISGGDHGGYVTNGGVKVTTSISNVGVNSYAELTAVPTNKAWRFKTWQFTSNASPASGYTATSNPIRVNATATSQTVTAVFEPRYALEGSRADNANNLEGMPGWSHIGGTPADFVVVDFDAVDKTGGVDLECTRTLLPNRRYKFKVLDRVAGVRRGQESSTSDMPANTNWELSHGNDVFFWTSGYGNYKFHITKMGASDTYYPSLQIDYPSAFELTMGKKVIYNEDNTTLKDASSEGTVTAHTNENSTGYDITSGQYFASGSQIVFTATPATGYEVEGWYNDADCAAEHKYTAGGNVTISGDKKTLTLANCTTATTVYVKFSEVMQEVELGRAGNDYEGTLSIGGVTQPWGTKVKVGVHTTVTVTAVPNEHYYFAHWYRFEGQNYVLSGETEDFATVTITGSVETPAWYGVYSDLLSPSFLQLERVYFYNWNFNSSEPLWASTDIYVGFNPNWDTNESPEHNYYGANMYGKEDLVVKMERVDDYSVSPRYNLWVADVPRKATKNSYTSIVFSDATMTVKTHFWEQNVTYRTDYNKDNNTFIPYHVSSGRYNFCDYYSDGYWKNYYNVSSYGQGYYLEQYKGSAWTELGEFTASESGYSPLLQYEVRVDNVDSDIKFRIKSAGGVYYKATSKLTDSNYSDVALTSTSGSDGFLITPTVEGEYTFYIDQTDEKMKVNLNYPVAIGDYRLKHTFSIRNWNNTSDSTVYAYSDIIKLANAAVDTVSMYIKAVDGNDVDTEIDGSLKLLRCDDIDDSKPVWSSGNAVSDYTLANFNKDKGVYKFAVKINTTSHTVTKADDIKLYDGPYYIKTDTAKGRWAHYKENKLDHNTLTFDKADASTYDYYFVSWIPYSRDKQAELGKKPTNVKCVIANDYNNAISDTLVGDAILGTYTEGGKVKPYENLPYQANVRFSYNSATNEVKRTYFQGASSDTYLYLVPNAASYVYDLTTPTPNDLYDSDPTDALYISQAKFSDDENWVYELKVQAYPGAQAGVQAKYNGKIQTLLPKTNTLIGGTKDEAKYTMRLVYDFKTNFLMSAYTPAGAITEALENIDVLIEREGQGAGTAITFSGSGALDAKKMIGAIKFTKTNYMSGSSSLVANWGDPGVRAKLKFLISFPFDVRMRDIFGLNGEYGRAYKIQRYDGAGRAKNGFFMGDGINSFWKDMTLADTIKANEGYAVICDNDYFGGTFGDIWKNNPPVVYLYFPSMEAVGDVEYSDAVTISVPAHECTKDREFTYFPEGGGASFKVNHKYTDSHWNMMGVPTFTNYTGDKTTGTGDYDPGTLFVDTEINPEHAIAYFYAWSDETNKFTITAAHGYAFKSMHGYMVQYTGDVTFKGTAIVPAAVAARRVVEQKKNYQIELQALNNNEEMINHTYVELRENACDTFALNEDVFMSSNSKAIEIFTFAGSYNVAANVLSVGNHTVPVGVTVNAAGTYTFTMPSNFDGTVTLIDTYTQTRTNLGLGDYEVSLPQGTTLDRFELEININQAPTAIDGVTDGSGSLKDGKAHKFIENEMLYILKDGVLYDARGNRVK